MTDPDLEMAQSIAKRYAWGLDGLLSATTYTAASNARSYVQDVLEQAGALLETIYGDDESARALERRDRANENGVFTLLAVLHGINPDEITITDLPDTNTLIFRHFL